MIDSVGPLTLADLWDQLARDCGDDPFLTFEGQEGVVHRVSYGQFDAETNRAANMLAAHGVRHGDNVALHLPNGPEFLGAQFALAKLGAVAVPIAAELQRRECEHIVERCQAQVVVVAAEWAQCYADMPGVRLLVIVGEHAGDPVPGVERIVSLADRRSHPPVLATSPDVASDDVAMILFTSGSTAAPKGVMITHANCIYAGWYGNWQAGMTRQDRMLTPMPMAHSNFQLAALMPVLTAGCELVIEARYSARRFWGQVRRHRATLVQAVAMMVRTLLLQPPADDADNVVRHVMYYLPLDAQAKDEFEARFGVRLLNSYGSTESICWVVTDFPFGPRRWPSPGRVGLGYQAKVVDDDGADLPPGATGELLVRGVPGRTLMKGYYRDPEATARALDSDGWLHTGDRCFFDADGYLFFVGRHQDLIKRSGENISALEVEAVLLEHPDVAQAAVIGVPEPIRGEAVRAFLVAHEGHALDVEQVLAFARTRLAQFKVPTDVVLADSLPQTSTGKTAKHLLDRAPMR
ncbi:crotonobetaine/carnitine-CoA ligase [Xylanimonas allomyrinae]|uniref:Crotonobetaine/carnitine-CoA ligase n=1 Tax=Xylanimonas allomyrinae TaxID=2509459 RepID=A0A4P6F2G8_9MICO|nr:AMP-binding protein [Xylanimonas allomyrinae]QAY64548.1 crotonobetaine/carnitine-CoA ligase [Xylanimonas allomyrinae]